MRQTTRWMMLLGGILILSGVVLWAGTGGNQAFLDSTGKLIPMLADTPLILAPDTDQDIFLSPSGSGLVFYKGVEVAGTVPLQKTWDDTAASGDEKTIDGLSAVEQLCLAGSTLKRCFWEQGGNWFENVRMKDTDAIIDPLRAVELYQQQAGDPAGNPTAGLWRLFFKSTGLFIENSGGTVTGPLGAGGAGAPTTATYLTQTADTTLSAEQALSALATGYMKVTTGTGVVTSQAVPIPAGDGGTANAFFAVTGPATSTKTFTFPNASATVLTDTTDVTVAQGGTGVSTLTGLVKGNGTGAFTTIPMEKCVAVENLDVADDDMFLGSFVQAVTITSVWCNYKGSAPTLAATFTLSDGAGNAMTITGTNPTCTAQSTVATAATVTAGNTLAAREVLMFDVTNTPNPATQTYQLCISYTID